MWLTIAWGIAVLEALIILGFVLERISIARFQRRIQSHLDGVKQSSEEVTKALGEAFSELGITQIESLDNPDARSVLDFKTEHGFCLFPSHIPNEQDGFEQVEKCFSMIVVRFKFEDGSFTMPYSEILSKMKLGDDYKEVAKRAIKAFIERTRSNA